MVEKGDGDFPIYNDIKGKEEEDFEIEFNQLFTKKRNTK